jgi:hypothetical protein
MLRPRRGSLHPLRRLWVAGIASGAIWATHAVAYVAATPDPHDRHSLLESTGHAYWANLAPIVVGLFIAGLIGAVLDRATSSSSDRMPSYRAVAARLAVLQVTGFLAIEIIERATADGVSATELLHPVFGVGLALQVIAALLGALLLVGVGMAVDAILHPARDGHGATPVVFNLGRTGVVRHLVPSSGGLSLRAPPALA